MSSDFTLAVLPAPRGVIAADMILVVVPYLSMLTEDGGLGTPVVMVIMGRAEAQNAQTLDRTYCFVERNVTGKTTGLIRGMLALLYISVEQGPGTSNSRGLVEREMELTRGKHLQ